MRHLTGWGESMHEWDRPDLRLACRPGRKRAGHGGLQDGIAIVKESVTAAIAAGGIDAGRTEAGRAKNRRVELVKRP